MASPTGWRSRCSLTASLVCMEGACHKSTCSVCNGVVYFSDQEQDGCVVVWLCGCVVVVWFSLPSLLAWFIRFLTGTLSCPNHAWLILLYSGIITKQFKEIRQTVCFFPTCCFWFHLSSPGCYICYLLRLHSIRPNRANISTTLTPPYICMHTRAGTS